MTGAQRQQVRGERDRIVRAGIDWQAVARCAGCGGELRDDFNRPIYLTGCAVCSDRRAKREQRERQRQAESVQLQLVAA